MSFSHNSDKCIFINSNTAGTGAICLHRMYGWRHGLATQSYRVCPGDRLNTTPETHVPTVSLTSSHLLALHLPPPYSLNTAAVR
ncbi:hypothetical protein GDO78_010651 [Eleutherodactylus coqui]|uniref:Uncharacterized protein n=1 Tax=Eleutherodactylus coqui TaxID=57060 RepID=A0A8J6F6B9_ELECQ|nr:hypothetical protein GDO78_010651 [Eleutherodactylus coqui]